MEDYFYAQIMQARNKFEDKVKSQPSQHFSLPQIQLIPDEAYKRYSGNESEIRRTMQYGPRMHEKFKQNVNETVQWDDLMAIETPVFSSHESSESKLSPRGEEERRQMQICQQLKVTPKIYKSFVAHMEEIDNLNSRFREHAHHKKFNVRALLADTEAIFEEDLSGNNESHSESRQIKQKNPQRRTSRVLPQQSSLQSQSRSKSEDAESLQKVSRADLAMINEQVGSEDEESDAVSFSSDYKALEAMDIDQRNSSYEQLPKARAFNFKSLNEKVLTKQTVVVGRHLQDDDPNLDHDEFLALQEISKNKIKNPHYLAYNTNLNERQGISMNIDHSKFKPKNAIKWSQQSSLQPYTQPQKLPRGHRYTIKRILPMDCYDINLSSDEQQKQLKQLVDQFSMSPLQALLKKKRKIVMVNVLDYSSDRFLESVRVIYNPNKRKLQFTQTGVSSGIMQSSFCILCQSMSSNFSVPIKQIKGVIIGQNTSAWQIKTEDLEFDSNEERRQPWRYVSIITEMRTYELEFTEYQQSFEFIIALNSLLNSQSKNHIYPHVVNKAMLGYYILKQRLKILAQKTHLGKSIGCLLLKGLLIYARKSADRTLKERTFKYYSVSKIQKIIQSYSLKEVTRGLLNCYERDGLLSCAVKLFKDSQLRSKLAIPDYYILESESYERDDVSDINKSQNVSDHRSKQILAINTRMNQNVDQTSKNFLQNQFRTCSLDAGVRLQKYGFQANISSPQSTYLSQVGNDLQQLNLRMQSQNKTSQSSKPYSCNEVIQEAPRGESGSQTQSKESGKNSNSQTDNITISKDNNQVNVLLQPNEKNQLDLTNGLSNVPLVDQSYSDDSEDMYNKMQYDSCQSAVQSDDFKEDKPYMAQKQQVLFHDEFGDHSYNNCSGLGSITEVSSSYNCQSADADSNFAGALPLRDQLQVHQASLALFSARVEQHLTEEAQFKAERPRLLSHQDAVHSTLNKESLKTISQAEYFDYDISEQVLQLEPRDNKLLLENDGSHKDQSEQNSRANNSLKLLIPEIQDVKFTTQNDIVAYDSESGQQSVLSMNQSINNSIQQEINKNENLRQKLQIDTNSQMVIQQIVGDQKKNVPSMKFVYMNGIIQDDLLYSGPQSSSEDDKRIMEEIRQENQNKVKQNKFQRFNGMLIKGPQIWCKDNEIIQAEDDEKSQRKKPNPKKKNSGQALSFNSKYEELLDKDKDSEELSSNEGMYNGIPREHTMGDIITQQCTTLIFDIRRQHKLMIREVVDRYRYKIQAQNKINEFEELVSQVLHNVFDNYTGLQKNQSCSLLFSSKDSSQKQMKKKNNGKPKSDKFNHDHANSIAFKQQEFNGEDFYKLKKYWQWINQDKAALQILQEDPIVVKFIYANLK